MSEIPAPPPPALPLWWAALRFFVWLATLGLLFTVTLSFPALGYTTALLASMQSLLVLLTTRRFSSQWLFWSSLTLDTAAVLLVCSVAGVLMTPFPLLFLLPILSTVLFLRSVEDREREMRAALPDVETLAKEREREEQNHQLREAYRELAAAAREQKSRLTDADFVRDLLHLGMEKGDRSLLKERLLKRLLETYDAESAVLWITGAQGEGLTVRAAVGPLSSRLRQASVAVTSEMLPSAIRRACEQRLLQEWRTETTLTSTPSGTAEPLKTLPEPPSDATGMPTEEPALLSTLLRSEDRLIGVLILADPRSAEFTIEQKERFADLAAEVARVVESLEERGQRERNLREISLLYEMSRLMQTSTDLESLYQGLIDLIGTLIPYENATIYVFDTPETVSGNTRGGAEGETRQLVPRVTRGQAVNLIDHIAFRQGNGVSGWVAEKRKQLFLPDLTREKDLLNVELIPPRVRSFLSVPMIVQENVVGVLNVSHSQAYAFSAEDVRLLTILAGQAALTIERGERVRSLEHLAITDGLTRLYNHRYLQHRLEQEIERARRYGSPLSVLMIDIDHFKQINDRYGHAAGDIVLTELGRVLTQDLRVTEIIARYGGEEFVIVLPQTSASAAVIAAERLRKRVETHSFPIGGDYAISLTISIGVAGMEDKNMTRTDLLERADKALYAAKENGRNAVSLLPTS